VLFKQELENRDHEAVILEQRYKMNIETQSDMLRYQLNSAVYCRLGFVCKMTTPGFIRFRHTVKEIEDFELQLLPHSPSSPDLAPSDFELFLDPKRRCTWKPWRIMRRYPSLERDARLFRRETPTFVGVPLELSVPFHQTTLREWAG